MSTGVAIIGFVMCLLTGALVTWGWELHQNRATAGETANAAWADDDSPVPISSKDPMWGNRDALVTIVQFSDFQCPFCARVEPTMSQVMQAYSKDQVRVVWKNNPLPMHQNAKPAAEAAAGVFALGGNTAFWKFHDKAFANQGGLSPANFETWAKDSGVDVTKFKAGIATRTWAEKVDRDMSVVKQLGVSVAPAFYINGVPFTGAHPFEQMKTVIDAELEKAKAKVAAGTKRDRVYVTMSQENKKNLPPPEAPKPKEDPNAIFKVPVGDSPELGNPNALVTMVLFSDFQCPFCGRVEGTVKALREKYGDKLRIVWKNGPLPFHNRAEPAAELALEARSEKGDKGFWEAHDKLFEKQKDLSDDALASIATELKLNPAKAKDAITNHAYKGVIDADLALGNTLQAGAKPHIFINGRRIVGADPMDHFVTVIDEELKRAQDAVAKGAPAAKVYDAVTKDGKTTG